MSQPHDEPRVTDYVFGELSPEQIAAFELELAQSPALRQEVAAIRQAVIALENEFESHPIEVSSAQRRVVEQAIGQRNSGETPVVSPLGNHADHAARRNAMVALLAASVLIAVGLTYPYWKGQTSSEISMVPPSNRDATEKTTAMAPKTSQVQVDALERSALGRSALSESALSEVGGRELTESNEAFAREEDSLALGLPALGDVRAKSRLSGREIQPPSKPIAENGLADLSALGEDASGTPTRSGYSPLAGELSTQMSQDGYDGAEASDFSGRGSLAGGAGGMGGSEPHPTWEVQLASPAVNDPQALAEQIASAQSSDHYLFESKATPTESGKQRRSRRDYGMMEEYGMMMSDDVQLSEEHMMEGGMDMAMGMGGEAMPDAFAVDAGVATNLSLAKRSDRERISALGDRYARINDNPFVTVSQAPLSTFSIDVDTASYSKIRSLLKNNVLPSPDAVRIEELLNYFDYDYPAPMDAHPFAASMEIATCPWNSDHRLARIGIQAREIETQRPPSNLVFLLDVSGSMNEPNKLPLVIEGMKLLTDQLTENDKVAIVVYAGAAGMVLDATRGDKKQAITTALERLSAGGSTNGGQGIVLAYQLARDHFINGGTNRVILCSDGDFNVGVTGTDELIQIAKENAGSSIFLSVLGFGTGNHNDEMMERLSNDGNGNYAFIDSKREAEKVFVEELGSTLVTVAKDVKIQIEFNPKQVSEYRLIGYENRMLKNEDFADDRKDAGEIGAGHTVTALYELVPAGSDSQVAASPDALRYQDPNQLTEKAASNEALLLKLRYKQPDGDTSTLMEVPVDNSDKSFQQTDRDFRFAAAVAGFGMLLRNSPHRGDLSFEAVHAIATESAIGDDFGYRTEFVELVKKARQLRGE